MGKKWAVVFEYDLKEGLCFMARKKGGKGDVALFDSKAEAEEWVFSDDGVDTALFEDINFIQLSA